MALFGFPKSEHLCLQRDIDALFAEPDGSANAWPIRCLWKKVGAAGQEGQQSAGPQPMTQVLISVAKRHLHHAVDRNRAKRQIREAYRLKKQLLQHPQNQAYHIAFIWQADFPQPSAKVHHSIHKLLTRIGTSGSSSR